MKTEIIEPFKIKGFSTRTKNKNEMTESTAQIAPLWEKTRNEIFPHLENDSTVYGVYYHYESDANGEFDVLAGADKLSKDSDQELSEVDIQAGKYLVFSNSGEMPKVIIDTWGEIWNYFSDENSEHKRAYTTDFERYKDFSSIDIYISVE